MKSLFITLLIIGGAFAGYDYFLAPPGEKIIFTDLNPPKKPKAAAPAAPVAEAEKPAENVPVPAPEAPKAAEAPKPAAPTPAPAPAAPAETAATKLGPKVESLESLTKNWQAIPATAFPRETTLLKDTEFKMAAGASKVTAGRKVQALAFANGMLALAPAPGSTARATVALADTDLQAVLTDIYEKWKPKRIAYLLELAAKKAQNQAAAPTSTPNTNTAEADAAGKPVRADNGTYPLLIASMRRGQVTEIKPDNIISWGEPQPTTLQGKQGWAIKVEFDAMTIFGKQQVEAQALVAHGQVQGWYYTGSGEEVP